MLDKEKKVQGIAVYAEFRRAGQTMQLIVTPDAYTTEGNLVPMTLIRRIVTKETPKKQWKNSTLRGGIDLNEMVTGKITLTDLEKSDFAETRMRHATHFFDQIVSQGWTIEQRPILVEVSRHDADDLIKGKTPNKIIYRVHISRKALGFPELVAA
jgi:hypothetical protein